MNLLQLRTHFNSPAKLQPYLLFPTMLNLILCPVDTHALPRLPVPASSYPKRDGKLSLQRLSPFSHAFLQACFKSSCVTRTRNQSRGQKAKAESSGFSRRSPFRRKEVNPGHPFYYPLPEARVDSCLLACKQGLHSYNQVNLGY